MCNNTDQSLIVYLDVEVVAQVPLEIFPAALLYYIGICQHKIDEEKVFHSLAGSERCSKYMRRGRLQVTLSNQITPVIRRKMTSGRGREASLIAAWTAKSVSLNSQPLNPVRVRHEV